MRNGNASSSATCGTRSRRATSTSTAPSSPVDGGARSDCGPSPRRATEGLAQDPASPRPAAWRGRLIDALLRASGSDVPSALALFRRLERESPAVVAAYQRLQLLRLLRHCRDHVPWYRRLLEEHRVDLSDGFSPDELRKLPVLDKETLRTHAAELTSDDAAERGAFRNSSGGSTGVPVSFLQDRAYRDRNVIAAKIIYNEILGK